MTAAGVLCMKYQQGHTGSRFMLYLLYDLAQVIWEDEYLLPDLQYFLNLFLRSANLDVAPKCRIDVRLVCLSHKP